MRGALLTMLWLAVLVACGRDEPTQVTGPAGKVVALEGSARASRGQEPARDLAVDDVVFAEDRIETDEGSSLVVRLDHNGALWNLAGKRAQVVRESLAWRAEASESSWKQEAVSSTAAGRPTVRQAGEDSRTVGRPRNEPTAGAEPETAIAGDAPQESAPAAGNDDAKQAVAATPPPPPPTDEGSVLAKGAEEREVGTIGGLGTSGSGGGSGSGSGIGSGSKSSRQPIAREGNPTHDVIARALASHQSELAKCTDPKTSGARLTLRFAVDAKGLATQLEVTGNAVNKACVEAVLAGIRFPDRARSSSRDTFPLVLENAE